MKFSLNLFACEFFTEKEKKTQSITELSVGNTNIKHMVSH